MSVAVSCPSCNCKLKAPDHLAGRTLSCPRCKASVAVPAAVQEQPPPRTAAAQQPPDKPTKDCPFCGEEILAAAKKCKHCGETLDVTLRAAQESDRAARRPRRAEAEEEPADDRRGRRGDKGGSGGTTVIVNAPPREFPHLLHIVLCLVTCGSWLPVYVLHAIVASRGGGSLLAFLIGVPLFLIVLGCAGFGIFLALVPTDGGPGKGANVAKQGERQDPAHGVKAGRCVVQLDKVQVVDGLPLEDGFAKIPGGLWKVTFKIKNAEKTPLRYWGWADATKAGLAPARLTYMTDQGGHPVEQYRPEPGKSIASPVADRLLQPGEQVEDAVYFPPPPAGVRPAWLHLDMDARAVGGVQGMGTDELKLRITGGYVPQPR